MNKLYDKVIGIDLGNGLIKIRSIYSNGKLYRKTLPSAFVKMEDIGYSVNHEELDIDLYEVDGQVYGWGIDIVNIKKPIYSLGHQSRYKSEAFKIMVKMVLAKAYTDLNIKPSERVLIVTGVPSTQTNTVAEFDMKEAFEGIVDIKLNSKDILLKVPEGSVEIMAQPVATVIGRYLDIDGSVLNSDYETFTVAVVDIGGGTTDFDIVEQLRRQNNYESIQHGFRDVYDKIRTFISTIYPTAKPTDFQLLECIREGNKTGKYIIQLNKRFEPTDIGGALKDAMHDLVMDIQQVITARWKSQTDLDEILLVGGSAELFEDMIENVLEGVTIPSNNGDSNVEGYYRYGYYLNTIDNEVD